MTMINSYSIHSFRHRRDQHGQSAVEMALLLPVILLLLFGVVMVVFIFYASIQVTNAAREGARAGSLYLLTMNNGSNLSLDQTVKNAIDNPTTSALGYLNKASSSFSVSCTLNGSACSTLTPNHGDQIKVTLNYSYTVPVLSVMLPMFPQPIKFSPQVTMVVQ